MNKTALSARPSRAMQPLERLVALWLWAEALLHCLGLPLLWALVWAVAALWLPPMVMPPLLQITITGIFWLVMAYALWQGIIQTNWPNAQRIKTRLERAGHMRHQPLQTLSDVPMRRHPLTDALWQHHQLRAAHRLERLRWPRLDAAWARRDGFAIRWLLLLLVLVGMWRTPDSGMMQLQRAFWPADWAALQSLAPGAWHLVVTPPPHTGLGPRYYSHEQPLPRDVVIPWGSRLQFQVSGGGIKPRFGTGPTGQKFYRAQDNFFVLETQIQNANRLLLKQGWVTLLDAPIVVQPDAPPRAVMQSLSAQSAGQLQFTPCVEDRYGLTALQVVWEYRGRMERRSLDLPPRTKSFCEARTLDVADSAAAGQSVQIWLSATNTAGLAVQSAPQNLTLPQYTFSQSLAADLARARQAWLLGDAGDDGLFAALDAALSKRLPTGLFLALQNARRAAEAGSRDVAASIIWQVALRLEEGEYADIAARWRASRAALLRELDRPVAGEDTLLLRLAEMQDAFAAYAPVLGQDPADYDKAFGAIAADIAVGQRKAARQLASALLPQAPPPDISDAGDALGGADILPGILSSLRAKLAQPDLPPDERQYYENLLREALGD